MSGDLSTFYGNLLLPVPQEIRPSTDRRERTESDERTAPHKSVKSDRAPEYRGPVPDPAELAAYRVGAPLPETVEDGGSSASLPKEGYELVIGPERIVLRYADDSGAYYGIQTLRQLITIAGSERRLRRVAVRDWPDLPHRGFMLDVSRSKVPTMKTFEELVALLGLLKMNELQLYTEHTFAYSGHEEVWADASPITPEEMRTLDDICRSHAVELVPNQNSFGHMRPWLTRSRYRGLAEAPDGFVDPWGNFRDYPFSLSPAVPETLELLDDLYGQLLPTVRSGRFNVGCDETFDLGQGRSRALCERRGKGAVYLEYLRQIHSLVRKRGKQMMFWADIVQQHPETIPQIPRDAVAIEWGYETDHPFDENCKRLRDAGIEFYVAPGTSTWNSLGGRWGVARDNIFRALSAAHRFGGTGMLLTEWGDNGYLQPYSTMLAPLAFGASGAWNRAGAMSEPWSWVALHVFGGDPGGSAPGRGSRVAVQAAPGTLLADALRLLAEIYRLHPSHIHNASVLGVLVLLQHLPQYARHLVDFGPESRRKAREILTFVDALCGNAGKGATASESEAAAAARDEIRFAARVMGFALSIAEGQTRAELRPVVDALEAEHRRLWARRYRPGGLSESVTFLRKQMDATAGA